MPPPGPSDIAQQQLQNRRRADDLHALGVLRPAHGVADRRRSSPDRMPTQNASATFRNSFLRHAAVLLHHLRRVAREMPLQNLEHAARVLQRRIGFVDRCVLPASPPRSLPWPPPASEWPGAASCLSSFLRCALVEPGLGIVLLLLRSQPEKTPPRSSVSRKSSRRSSPRWCSARTYSWKSFVILENVVDQCRRGRGCRCRRAAAPRCRPSPKCA